MEWGKKKTVSVPQFCSRSDAFRYMLQYQLEQGCDPMEAAKRADQFADVFAKNMNLPEVVEPQPQGIDKYLASIDKVSTWVDQHPKVVELIIPTVTFIAGLFTGRKTTEQTPAPPPQDCEPIDFNNIED